MLEKKLDAMSMRDRAPTQEVITLTEHNVEPFKPSSRGAFSAKQVQEQQSNLDEKGIPGLSAQTYFDVVSRPSSPPSPQKKSGSFILTPNPSTKPQRWGACTYLAGMFVLETMIWGFASSYGVFLDYYLHSRFARDPNANFLLPLVGTVNTGLMAFLIPVISVILNRYPNLKNVVMYTGLAITSLSLFLSSFSTHSIHILLTLGIGYGIGGVAVYYPALTYLPEWFPERPGLANGIVFSGNGFGGLAFPFIMHRLLVRCGVELALRYLTVIIIPAVGVSLYFTRPLRETSTSKIVSYREAIGDREALIAGALWFFVLANTLQALSYFLPSLYLPDYAHNQALPSYSGTTFLAALNIANSISRLVFGTLSDHVSTHFIGCTTSLVASISVLVFWGSLKIDGFKSLFALSILFGATSGAWTSLYFAAIKEWRVDDRTTMTMYSLMSATRGLANIVCGPISSALLSRASPTVSKNGFSSCYSGVIMFCGATMLGAAAIEGGLYIHQIVFMRRRPLESLHK